MIAVLFQNFDRWIALIVFTRKCCSSSGSEYPAWPSWYSAALRKLTAGRFPCVEVLVEPAQVVLMVGLPVVPDLGQAGRGRWSGLAVEA